MFVTIQDSTRHVLDSQISEYRAECKGRKRAMVQPALNLLLDASIHCATDTEAQAYFTKRQDQAIEAHIAAKNLTAPWWNLSRRIDNHRTLRQATKALLVAHATDSWFFHVCKVWRQNERRAWNALNPQDS